MLTVVAATARLDPAERAAVDQRLAGARVERWGVRRIHDLAARLAMEVAPDRALVRARSARAGRHVRVRLAADGMADLVAHLPAEQAAACMGALHRAVNELYVTAESPRRPGRERRRPGSRSAGRPRRTSAGAGAESKGTSQAEPRTS